jgi:hypothetical protein
MDRDHYADIVEEHEAKERVFEEAVLISEYQHPDVLADLTVQRILASIKIAVRHYQQIHGRNDDIRREEERLRQVMLS